MSDSKRDRSERGLWQRRFWKHTVRDEKEFEAVCDYIHYNPVKHGHAECPHGWAYSGFHPFVKRKIYAGDWCCGCREPVRQSQVPQVAETITGE